MNLAKKLWQRGLDLLPTSGFHFDRPLVLLQSDDWGRVGLRDHEGREQLRAAGLVLGERPYDSYTLETADDVAALSEVLGRHHDSGGRSPCIEMNFVSTNLDFAKMREAGFQKIRTLALADGLPEGWSRPGLMEGYRAGIAKGIFYPAVHGTTHFCIAAVERNLTANEDRAALLRTLWQASTPYIYWRMPWIGYEYWDPEQPEDERFLPRETQKKLIGEAIGAFARLFSYLPRSGVAPGHRANGDTHRAWAQHGIRVSQNGSGVIAPPHFDRYEVLNLSRVIDFEPATDAAFSLENCLHQAESCFARGLPAIVSLHSINFHSTVEDFRSRTLRNLDEFLAALEARHSDLLYLHDADLYELVTKGQYESRNGVVNVKVTKKTFIKAAVARQGKA